MNCFVKAKGKLASLGTFDLSQIYYSSMIELTIIGFEREN